MHRMGANRAAGGGHGRTDSRSRRSTSSLRPPGSITRHRPAHAPLPTCSLEDYSSSRPSSVCFRGVLSWPEGAPGSPFSRTPGKRLVPSSTIAAGWLAYAHIAGRRSGAITGCRNDHLPECPGPPAAEAAAHWSRTPLAARLAVLTVCPAARAAGQHGVGRTSGGRLGRGNLSLALQGHAPSPRDPWRGA